MPTFFARPNAGSKPRRSRNCGALNKADGPIVGQIVCIDGAG
jgi:hypothetical protein